MLVGFRPHCVANLDDRGVPCARYTQRLRKLQASSSSLLIPPPSRLRLDRILDPLPNLHPQSPSPRPHHRPAPRPSSSPSPRPDHRRLPRPHAMRTGLFLAAGEAEEVTSALLPVGQPLLVPLAERRTHLVDRPTWLGTAPLAMTHPAAPGCSLRAAASARPPEFPRDLRPCAPQVVCGRTFASSGVPCSSKYSCLCEVRIHGQGDTLLPVGRSLVAHVSQTSDDGATHSLGTSTPFEVRGAALQL